MTLLCTDMTVRFGTKEAIYGIDLHVDEGEHLSLIGPSGSGKTTLLRAIAGLEPLASGRVVINGEDLTAVPPHRRSVGLMFQSHALFPHLSVGKNVEFGLRMEGWSQRERQRRAQDLLELVGLEDLAQRGVHTLSGGQQQRVALARAVAPQPSLLMLDEPFAQLDRELSRQLVSELKEVFSQLGVSVLAVMHNLEDACALGDRIIVMGEGKVHQSGAPQEVWRHPSTVAVARFLGYRNISEMQREGSQAYTVWGSFPWKGEAGGHIVVPAESARIDGEPRQGAWKGRVHSVTFQPGGVIWSVECGGELLDVLPPPGMLAEMGQEVWVTVDPRRCLFLEH